MSDRIIDYLKSLNPKKEEQVILFYGSRYKLWKEGKYLGEAIWTKDEFVGDSFQTIGTSIFDSREINVVHVADKWELVPGTEKVGE